MLANVASLEEGIIQEVINHPFLPFISVSLACTRTLTGILIALVCMHFGFVFVYVYM